MPHSGARFNYLCTSFGKYGWYSSPKTGYCYLSNHPKTGEVFPAIPESVLSVVEVCKTLTGESNYRAETCLTNWYSPTGSVGMHQDNTEKSRGMIISMSFGASARFVLGTTNSRNFFEEVILHSGDIFILSGEHRMTYHAMPRMLNTPSGDIACDQLGIQPGYRLNLTIRQVDL